MVLTHLSLLLRTGREARQVGQTWGSGGPPSIILVEGTGSRPSFFFVGALKALRIFFFWDTLPLPAPSSQLPTPPPPWRFRVMLEATGLIRAAAMDPFHEVKALACETMVAFCSSVERASERIGLGRMDGWWRGVAGGWLGIAGEGGGDGRGGGVCQVATKKASDPFVLFFFGWVREAERSQALIWDRRWLPLISRTRIKSKREAFFSDGCEINPHSKRCFIF